jgi:hypothetical protein
MPKTVRRLRKLPSAAAPSTPLSRHQPHYADGCESCKLQPQRRYRRRDSLGEAVVKIKHDGEVYTGTGISTDIIESSIRAYINGINKIAAD